MKQWQKCLMVCLVAFIAGGCLIALGAIEHAHATTGTARSAWGFVALVGGLAVFYAWVFGPIMVALTFVSDEQRASHYEPQQLREALTL